jgi:hypothetical protein
MNKCIRIYNRFIQLVFKNKGLDYSKAELNQIVRLAAMMNVALPRKAPNHQMFGNSKQSFWVEFFRSPQTGGLVKE